VSFKAKSAIVIFPHTQDPGRLYVYSRLWCPVALHTLKERFVEAKNAWRTGVGAAGAHPARSDATARHASRRIALTLELGYAALRFECSLLERRLCITRAIHLQTASAVTALDKVRALFAAHRSASIGLVEKGVQGLESEVDTELSFECFSCFVWHKANCWILCLRIYAEGLRALRSIRFAIFHSVQAAKEYGTMRETALARVGSAQKRRGDPIAPQIAELPNGDNVRQALLPVLCARDRCGHLVHWLCPPANMS
jgi:hypothetical protein